ncbi:hypothetical protein M5K25_006668 [Dendrobium thyrsiflorum]|uniref:Uncharacterized protein n=1 Tax=Dendrobium thyrsiflorum TaxID=117978 RepID=A0ABD0VJF5_DENTH
MHRLKDPAGRRNEQRNSKVKEEEDDRYGRNPLPVAHHLIQPSANQLRSTQPPEAACSKGLVSFAFRWPETPPHLQQKPTAPCTKPNLFPVKQLQIVKKPSSRQSFRPLTTQPRVALTRFPIREPPGNGNFSQANPAGRGTCPLTGDFAAKLHRWINDYNPGPSEPGDSPPNGTTKLWLWPAPVCSPMASNP